MSDKGGGFVRLRIEVPEDVYQVLRLRAGHAQMSVDDLAGLIVAAEVRYGLDYDTANV